MQVENGVTSWIKQLKQTNSGLPARVLEEAQKGQQRKSDLPGICKRLDYSRADSSKARATVSGGMMKNKQTDIENMDDHELLHLYLVSEVYD